MRLPVSNYGLSLSLFRLFSVAFAGRKHIHHFHHELKVFVGRHDSIKPILPIRKCRRTSNLHFGAHFESWRGILPTLNDLSLADRETKRLLPLVRTINQSVSACQPSLIVNEHARAGQVQFVILIGCRVVQSVNLELSADCLSDKQYQEVLD